MKLFVGRLPREVTQRHIRECFEDFGEVLEVFLIDSQAMSNVGCAFVRMSRLEQAKQAVQDLHEQRVILPEFRESGPMQVAFAKGETMRLGLKENEETLPSFKEARQKVVEHKEKRRFFEAVHRQQRSMRKQYEQAPPGGVAISDLIGLVKDGQRHGGQAFKHKWRSFCDQGWAGIYDYDPSHHRYEALMHFVATVAPQYGHEQWMKTRLRNLPPGALLRPPVVPGLGPPGMAPPPMMPPPPCGMLHGLPPPNMGPPHLPPFFMMPPPLYGGGPWQEPMLEQHQQQRQDRKDTEKEVVDVEPRIDLDAADSPPDGATDDAVPPDADADTAATTASLLGRKMQDYTDVDAVSIDSG